jgi:hypothetical protein
MKGGTSTMGIWGHALFSLIITVSLSGCSIGTTKLYPGPEISGEKLSFINNHHSQVRVTELDSQKIMIGTWMDSSGGAKERGSVLPGKHTFKVEYMFYNNNVMVGPVIVEMETDLAAGHEYVFDAKQFYLKGIGEEDCRVQLLGAPVEFLVNQQDAAGFGGAYCSALVPYLFDKEKRKIALTTLKKNNFSIVIDDSTPRPAN